MFLRENESWGIADEEAAIRFDMRILHVECTALLINKQSRFKRNLEYRATIRDRDVQMNLGQKVDTRNDRPVKIYPTHFLTVKAA